MAMLRVSSYRRLFEEENWSRNGRLGCAGQYRASVDCDKLDFVAAKALNKDGLNRFIQDRTIIAALNDRLVRLIELAHCFEEENESLECQIVDLEEKLNRRPASSSITSTRFEPDYSLDAVVERLRRERQDEILCETEELQKELEHLMKEYEKAAQQRILLQQGRQDVAEQKVDTVTAECLALREQVAIYEEQLANMEAQHSTPDIAPALDVKAYYCQLAESLQISALQKELAGLEKCNEELEDEVEMKRAAYMDQIAELESTIDEMQNQEADFQVQMREQCEDYKELLSEKMARDMEITAY
uniref:Peripherin-like n=1 Tax=Labrus bergylta TaxID=56723 RepID=A0A3Q3GYX8_9LABR